MKQHSSEDEAQQEEIWAWFSGISLGIPGLAVDLDLGLSSSRLFVLRMSPSSPGRIRGTSGRKRSPPFPRNLRSQRHPQIQRNPWPPAHFHTHRTHGNSAFQSQRSPHAQRRSQRSLRSQMSSQIQRSLPSLPFPQTQRSFPPQRTPQRCSEHQNLRGRRLPQSSPGSRC